MPSRAAEWIAEEREAKRRRRAARSEEQAPVTDSIGLTEAFWPEERLTFLTGLVDRYLREGDLTRASLLRYGIAPQIEEWQMMRVVAKTKSRRVLRDFEGNVWIAASVDEVGLPDGTD